MSDKHTVESESKNSGSDPPTKKKKLFSFMDDNSSNTSNTCLEDGNEFQKYLANQNFTKHDNALRFW